MTDSSPPGSQAAPQRLCALLVMCVECGTGIELPLPIDNRTIGILLARHGWFITVMGPPVQGSEEPMVLGPLCRDCAQKVYAPEVFAEAEQRRQQLLQVALSTEIEGKKMPR